MWGLLLFLNLNAGEVFCIETTEERLTQTNARLQILSSLYWARLGELIALEVKFRNRSSETAAARNALVPKLLHLATVIKSNLGLRAIEGLEATEMQPISSLYVGQLLPHLLVEPAALWPAYHLRSARASVDTVIGIPTVHRDPMTYIILTITHIIQGLTKAQLKETLIVIFVGETDLLYILNTAILIEKSFPNYVHNGLIEVIAPTAAYYPDLRARRPTLGDSSRRFKWRTKQNLDILYLMAYCQSKGAYYLMLEDDVIARKFFMTEIKRFREKVTLKHPQWIYIEFNPRGCFGKLFRSSSLLSFLVYVQLFYEDAPIDWLLDNYLDDKVCVHAKFTKDCAKRKLSIRPQFNGTLFTHAGLYSTLNGKLQEIGIKLSYYPKFFPHKNPPVKRLWTTMEEVAGHSLRRAYSGETYFLANRAHAGDVLEFWFQRPTIIDRYLIRSGNVVYNMDRLYNGVVEVITVNGSQWEGIGDVNEFGLAEGDLRVRDCPPLHALRLRLLRSSRYALLISEEIKRFREKVTLKHPQWIYIEFNPRGCFGKLFRSSSLLSFLVYVQLFYEDAPIDWLLDNYLDDKVCVHAKFTKDCAKRKLSIRPQFNGTLFTHAGLYSTLNGKLQEIGIKLSYYPKFFPHKNPPVKRLWTTMEEVAGHSLRRAYSGETYFLANRAHAGDVLEFWFQRPTIIDRYLIRSGNVVYNMDRLYNGVVEVITVNGSQWEGIGDVNEFGLAEGDLRVRDCPPLHALRLRLLRSSRYALLISEIDLSAAEVLPT